MSNADLVLRVKRDYHTAGLEPADVAMLEYVEKLTMAPGDVAQTDVQQLLDLGFSDQQVLDVCTATAYHNFNTRMADGLGVQLDNRYDYLEADFRAALIGSDEAVGNGRKQP